MSDGSPVPFTVIGGFLGAGKTTLLNQILRDAAGERIVILVNDVGDTPIDPDLIASRAANTITLTNGCICCSLGDEFALRLPDLLAMEPPIDRVVVEASGIGDPGRIAQYGTLPGFALDGVIVLADAERIEALLTDARIGHQVAHQLQRANLVVLTKVDLVDAQHLTTARSVISATLHGTRIPIIESRFGQIPSSVLFGLGPDGLESKLYDSDHHGFDHHGFDHHGFEVWTHVPTGPIARTVLDAWLDGLPDGVLRVKGRVNLDQASSVSIQKVGPRCRVTARPEPTDEPRIVVVAIAGTELSERVW